MTMRLDVEHIIRIMNGTIAEARWCETCQAIPADIADEGCGHEAVDALIVVLGPA